MKNTTTQEQFYDFPSPKTGSLLQDRMENNIEFETPRPHIVNAILNYSKALEVKHSEKYGYTEYLIN